MNCSPFVPLRNKDKNVFTVIFFPQKTNINYNLEFYFVSENSK